MEERKKRNRRASLVIAVMLTLFVLLTYLMTFVIAHFAREG